MPSFFHFVHVGSSPHTQCIRCIVLFSLIAFNEIIVSLLIYLSRFTLSLLFSLAALRFPFFLVFPAPPRSVHACTVALLICCDGIQRKALSIRPLLLCADFILTDETQETGVARFFAHISLPVRRARRLHHMDGGGPSGRVYYLLRCWLPTTVSAEGAWPLFCPLASQQCLVEHILGE